MDRYAKAFGQRQIILAQTQLSKFLLNASKFNVGQIFKSEGEKKVAVESYPYATLGKFSSPFIFVPKATGKQITTIWRQSKYVAEDRISFLGLIKSNTYII